MIWRGSLVWYGCLKEFGLEVQSTDSRVTRVKTTNPMMLHQCNLGSPYSLDGTSDAVHISNLSVSKHIGGEDHVGQV